jgi:hypothetical protein
VIVKRWQEQTGGMAVREDGVPFGAAAAERPETAPQVTEAAE